MHSLGTRRQRTESAKKELCFMRLGQQQRCQPFFHRKCFCCISEQQCSLKCLVSVDFIPFSSQHVRTSMPGYQRCHLRLNAPVQELEDSFKRYNSFPAQYMPLLFHGRVLMAFLHQRRVSLSPDPAIGPPTFTCVSTHCGKFFACQLGRQRGSGT